MHTFVCYIYFVFLNLGFLAPPRIEAFTFPSHVVVGKNISTFCSASNSQFFWFKDGEILVNSPNVTIKTDEDFSILIIRAVSLQSGGNYTCMATNNFGVSSQSAVLTIISKLLFGSIWNSHQKIFCFFSLKFIFLLVINILLLLLNRCIVYWEFHLCDYKGLLLINIYFKVCSSLIHTENIV